jgi:hypothetical protein
MLRWPSPLLLVTLAAVASAEEPTVRLGGEVFGSLAPRDAAYFNATDYETSALRTLRLSLQGEVRLGARLSLLAEARVDDVERARLHAAYLRATPWPGRPIDVQAGRIPPVFGAFARRRYASEVPVPGYPLAYQYLVALRPDSLPASAADLARNRTRGWRVVYPIGVTEPGSGVPLLSSQRWDTGVQARVGGARWQVAASLTQGTPSVPRLEDDNGGKQLAARATWTPSAAITVGASGASGDWVADRAWSGGGSRRQVALGADLEWSGGPWLARAELVRSAWGLPTLDASLDATSVCAEGRLRVAPGVTLGARADRLWFGDLPADSGPWETAVTRLSAGASWAVRRTVSLRAGLQLDARDQARYGRRKLFPVAQVLWWF